MTPFRILLAVLALLVAVLLWPLPPNLEGADAPAEAPAGFDDGTNGFVDQAKHDADRMLFEATDTPEVGLGPTYNGTSCAECHFRPITGGFSTVTELRAGHLDETGTFVPATAYVNFNTEPIPLRSLINKKAICDAAVETLRAIDDIHADRISLNLLGDGFVEAISDTTLDQIRLSQPSEMQGEKVTEDTAGKPNRYGFKIGRFGWKDQHTSLVDFTGDAYLNEVGISNNIAPNHDDFTHLCEPDNPDTVDPEDHADVDKFTRFIRATKVPPRGSTADSIEAVNGAALFKSIGCETCHVSTIVTDNGLYPPAGSDPVPSALANKIIHPYSDFLLHRVGTGDGIVQNGAPNTRFKIRTAPLWGLRKRGRFLHDGSETTLEGAIQRHRNEAQSVTDRYNLLIPTEQGDIIAFLQSL